MNSFAKKFRYFSMAIISFGLIISFQNCGKQAEFVGGSDGGVIEASSLSFSLRYPTCSDEPNTTACGMANQELEFWVEDAQMNVGGGDGKVYSQKSNDMNVVWRVRAASNIPMQPQEMTGNPGAVTMEPGLYDIQVEVRMDGIVSTKDFQLIVKSQENNPTECLPLEDSLLIEGNENLIADSKDYAKAEYTVVDLNNRLGNHRMFDDRLLNCYSIMDVKWERAHNKVNPEPVGEGNPNSIDFRMLGLHSVIAKVEVSFPGMRRRTEIVPIQKLVTVDRGDSCISRAIALQPRVLVSSLSYRVGSSVDMRLQLPDCWEHENGAIQSIVWEVDGKEVSRALDYNVSVIADRSGTVPVRVTIQSFNRRAVAVIETSYVIQGQSCEPCAPGKDYQCLDVWCPPPDEVM